MFLLTLGFAALLAAAEGAPAPQQGDEFWRALISMAPMLIGLGVFYYLLIVMPMKKDQKQRQDMLGNVKKNDRVLTTSGIYGIVTNVQKEQNEITIRVDEATNAKLRLTLNSIARILGNESPESSEPNGGKAAAK